MDLCGAPKNGFVLHVGLMKTATTYFQFILKKNRQNLQNLGWLYPGVRDNQQHAFYNICGGAIPWVTEKMAETYAVIGEKLVSDLRDASIGRIASSEALATLREPDITALIEKVGRPDLVVFTIRGLTTLIPSAWQQYVKGGGTITLEQYINKMVEERSPVSSALGAWQVYAYGESVRRWATACGAPINVVIVSNKTGDGRSSWQRFQEAAGLPDISDIDVPSSEKNISLSLEMAEVLRKYNCLCKQNGYKVDQKKFLKNVVMPTSHMGLGKKISLPAEFCEIVSGWNKDEMDKVVQHAANIFGDISEII